MFWLSYESFSILSDVFFQKCVISSESSCDGLGFHGRNDTNLSFKELKRDYQNATWVLDALKYLEML